MTWWARLVWRLRYGIWPVRFRDRGPTARTSTVEVTIRVID